MLIKAGRAALAHADIGALKAPFIITDWSNQCPTTIL
jgi:hypothetical protein